jgi:hypothetical protein
MAEPYEAILARVAEETGGRQMSPAEAQELLELARRVAHVSGDRRAAPLVCFAAGGLTAGEEDANARAAQIRALLDLFPPEDSE